MAVANYAELSASRRCGNGLREEAADTLGVANRQIHICQSEPFLRISARSKPVFGVGVGESLRVAGKQFAIPLRSQLDASAGIRCHTPFGRTIMTKLIWSGAKPNGLTSRGA